MNTKSNSSFMACTLQARIAIIGYAIAGFAVAAGSLWMSNDWVAGQSLGLIALSIATARMKVRLTETATISLLTSTVMLALMIGGTGVAVVAGICGVITQNVFPARKLVFHQLAFNAGMIALTAAASGAVYNLLLQAVTVGFAEQFAAAVAASLMYFLCNSSSIAVIIGLTKRLSVIDVWKKHMVPTTPSFLLAGMVSLSLFQLLLNPMTGLVFSSVPMLGSVYYVSLLWQKPAN
jgi:hypothetical protein